MATTITRRQRAYSTTATPLRSFSLTSQPLVDPGNECLNTGIGGAEHIQVLFAHSESRIVNFTFTTSALNGEPLPWSSPLERTIASGPLRIYKTVPHNIAFLQSGPALKPLLSRTQCWNLDGKKVFCLQLRPGNYWRIEILGLDFQLDIKCAEFRDAMAKLVAFEVTACPFSRSATCIPVMSTPEVLQPAKVWKRPPLRRVKSTEKVKSPIPDPRNEGPGGLQVTRKRAERTANPERIRPKLDCAISLEEGPSQDLPKLSKKMSWRETFPETFQQRRALYESPTTSRRTSFAEGFKPSLQELKQDENIPRRGSLGGDVFFGRWPPATTMEAEKEVLPAHAVEKDDDSEENQENVKCTSFVEDYGLEPEEDQSEQPESFGTSSATKTYGSTVSPLPIKTTQMVTSEFDFGALPEYSSSTESAHWQDFTPPQSPLSGARLKTPIGTPPPFAAPPILIHTSALGVSSRHPTRPSTPEDSVAPIHWYTPAQHMSTCEQRQSDGPALATVELAAAVSSGTLQIPYTPARTSGFESEPDEPLRTPSRSRSFAVAADTYASRPLRRAASSQVLARTANIAASAANFVVLKPSAFLVALMFSIAARLATRAVAGAAHSLAERGELGGWDDDSDDYGLAPQARSERRRRRSETCERSAWGLEDRSVVRSRSRRLK
ncbi:inheritance of peroxisomes protein 1-domain-containing protein [Tricharina praecox]|uniref:inheritance of peroxisomes protein 1-domain-containing protein n=1 Tax=Tricharina praecox TaxID=43433 RepID=UPI00221F4917|nr:inheritance of peroxisomes protein 1-domain-containing protein [Tricharina praecox]KAI5855410.1 inheritance of peroxisomes protein 1-domain-containing protein [Tricharina praecox]